MNETDEKFWKLYPQNKPTLPAIYEVEMADGTKFPAFWSMMWNQFKVGDVLLIGVKQWR